MVQSQCILVTACDSQPGPDPIFFFDKSPIYRLIIISTALFPCWTSDLCTLRHVKMLKWVALKLCGKISLYWYQNDCDIGLRQCCAGSCAWWCSQLLGEFLKREILFDFSVFYWWWWEHRLGHLAVYQIQSSNVDNYIFYFWKTPATQNWKPLLVVGARQLLLGRSFTNRRENMWEDKFLC